MQAAFYQLTNPIMTYAWGSHTALADLLGQPQPSAEPQAELWMGAHPKAPSVLAEDAGHDRLDDLIAADPPGFLGAEASGCFDGRLPFLFKVLAAREPLSIQAHPSLQQARAGFAQENQAGIPLDAAHRNYRDDNHKPELICALTPFWALCGFRSADQIARLLGRAGGDCVRELVEPLRNSGGDSVLRHFWGSLLSLSATRRNEVLEEIVGYCIATREDAAHWQWIPRLAKAYPGDIGALAPLFLNLICLQPGEGLFLPAGVLHAYLEGTGIEIMANSDNVLRGGLTPKHVDLPELLKVLDFQDHPLEVLAATPVRPGLTAFDAFCPEFQLYQVFPDQAGGEIELDTHGPEILLCTEGTLTLRAGDPEQKLSLQKGGSAFIPAATETYHLAGTGVLFRATVPPAAAQTNP